MSAGVSDGSSLHREARSSAAVSWLNAKFAECCVVEDAALSKTLRLLKSPQRALGVGPDNAVNCAVVVTQAFQFELRAHRDEKTLIGSGTRSGRCRRHGSLRRTARTRCCVGGHGATWRR